MMVIIITITLQQQHEQHHTPCALLLYTVYVIIGGEMSGSGLPLPPIKLKATKIGS